MQSAALHRTATMLQRRVRLTPEEGATYTREFLAQERAAFESITGFAAIPDGTRAAPMRSSRARTGDRSERGRGSGEGVDGIRAQSCRLRPTIVFGYDYLIEHLHGAAPPRLLSFTGMRGTGADYAYEVLNFVNGKRGAQEIRDKVSAEFGPVSIELVTEYLRALETAGMVTASK